MKLIAIGVATFLVCLAGVTLATRPRATPPAVAAGAVHAAVAARRDTATADSGARAARGGAPAPADSARADTAATPRPPAGAAAASPAPAPSPRSSAVAAAPSGTARARRPIPPPPVSPDRSQLYRRLSRIFSNMKAADAAGVFAKLTDEEVVGILTQLGARQAASLMGALPKDRAAVISHRLLVPAPAGTQ